MNAKYRVGVMIKIPSDNIDNMLAIVKENIRHANIKYLKSGIRLMNWRINTGLDGDDFIKNSISVICNAEVFRVPRFVKNHLLKTNYEIRNFKHR